MIIKQYDIDDSIPKDLLGMAVKLRILKTASGLVPTRNQPNSLTWLQGLKAVKDGVITRLLKNGKEVRTIKEGEGCAYVLEDAKTINVLGRTNAANGVATANVALEITALRDGDRIAYKFSSKHTEVNGLPWLESPKNTDFKVARMTWIVTNADNGALADKAHYITPQSDKGTDLHEIIISRHADFPGVTYVFSEEDAEDIDREQLAALFHHGADKDGKGIFGWLAIDLKTECLKLYE